MNDSVYEDPGAKVVSIDFSKADPIRLHKSGKLRDRGNARDLRPTTPEGKLLTPKQIRARARRRAMKQKRELMTEQEFEALYKPIEEWDLEELARGRPRNSNGNFSGPTPQWITRDVHEKSMELFTAAIKTEMGSQGIAALDTIRWILGNEETDNKGKPMVPAATKLQASTFLLEHIVGKPKQHIETDISVKLQAVLGAVMANPNEAFAPPSQGGLEHGEEDTPAYGLAHYPGHTIPIGVGPTVPGELVDDDSDLEESNG